MPCVTYCSSIALFEEQLRRTYLGAIETLLSVQYSMNVSYTALVDDISEDIASGRL